MLTLQYGLEEAAKRLDARASELEAMRRAHQKDSKRVRFKYACQARELRRMADQLRDEARRP